DGLLLGRQLVARLVRPPARLRAGGLKLVPRALREGIGAHRRERLVRLPQLLARVEPPALAPQPLAVQQPRAGELWAQRGAPEAIDGLAVPPLGGLALGQQGAAPRRPAVRPIAGAGLRSPAP